MILDCGDAFKLNGYGFVNHFKQNFEHAKNDNTRQMRAPSLLWEQKISQTEDERTPLGWIETEHQSGRKASFQTRALALLR